MAGNGKRGTDLTGGKIGAEQTLALPWDLEIDNDNRQIYVAMAALHQIWKIDIQTSY